jgi:hypothetical protein
MPVQRQQQQDTSIVSQQLQYNREHGLETWAAATLIHPLDLLQGSEFRVLQCRTLMSDVLLERGGKVRGSAGLVALMCEQLTRPFMRQLPLDVSSKLRECQPDECAGSAHTQIPYTGASLVTNNPLPVTGLLTTAQCIHQSYVIRLSYPLLNLACPSLPALTKASSEGTQRPSSIVLHSIKDQTAQLCERLKLAVLHL